MDSNLYQDFRVSRHFRTLRRLIKGEEFGPRSGRRIFGWGKTVGFYQTGEPVFFLAYCLTEISWVEMVILLFMVKGLLD